MRIIAGQYRRRKLLSNPGMTTRPITDFVKESLFARIEDRLQGQRIADVFSGTGTIGLEALSRGAASVAFFERDAKAFELLQQNVEMLKANDDCFCWKADIFRCSFRPKGNTERFVPFDWMFFDPPFAMIEELVPGSELFRVLKQVAREGITSPEARLVLRTPRRSEFVMPSPWEMEHDWPFSHMHVFIYRKGKPAEQTSDLTEAGEAEADTMSNADSAPFELTQELASDPANAQGD